MKLLAFIKNHDWQLLEEAQHIRLFPYVLYYNKVITEKSKLLNVENFKYLITIFENDNCYIYGEVADCIKTGKKTLEKIKKMNYKFLDDIEKILQRDCEDLTQYANQIYTANLSKLGNKELWNLLSNYLEKYYRMMQHGTLPNILDYGSKDMKNALLDYLEDYLTKIIKNKKKIPEIMAALTTPDRKTLFTEERLEFFKLALEVKKDKKLVELIKVNKKDQIIKQFTKLNPRIDSLIQKHIEKYAWMSYKFIGPVWWDKKYFITQLMELLSNGDIASEIKKIQEQTDKLEVKRKTIRRENKFDKLHLFLFKVAREGIYIKAYRADLMVKSFYHISKLLGEIAGRINLKFEDIGNMYPEEINKALLSNSVNQKFLTIRKKIFVEIRRQGKITVIVGDEATSIKKFLRKEKIQQTGQELKGICASPGKIIGIVKVINNEKDMLKMNNGDIVISSLAQPMLTQALRQASAIVTDFGGMTCHASIISRELNIPCVVGTKIACKILKDNQKIEVNANKGLVKIIEN